MAVVWTYLRSYRWLCLSAVVFVLLEANFELLLPGLMARMIDEGVRRGDLGCILRTGGWMAGVALAGIGCVLVRNLCSGTASQRFGADLRRGLFAHILRLSEAGAGRVGTAGLVSRMTGDTDQLAKSVNSALRIGVKAPVLCVGSVLCAVRLNAGLSLAVLAVVLAVLGLIARYMYLSGRRFSRVRTAMDRLNTVVQEFLRGIRLIKALGREGDEDARFRAANGELAEAGIRLQLLSAWFAPLITLTVNLGVAGVLWLAGAWEVEAGKVAAFVTYMTQMLSALMTLIDVFKLLVRSDTSAKRVSEVFALPVEEDPERPEAPGGRGPALEFRDVRFAYPGGSGVPALDGIRFTLERGELLAVVGPTGAGKSTLAWLCARLYDPQEGQVLLDGRDLRRLSLRRIRRQVAVAAQRSDLFSGTIEKNLAMGDAAAGGERMRMALSLAQAEDFVAGLGGLAGTVEQGGANLSGGQRQRLSLARALVRESAVLVLDDCTGALDAVTEGRVLSGLGRRADRAVLLITQRVRTAALADRILVLEDGRQAGLGTHAALLETCPAYREIWNAQGAGEEGRHGGA